MWRRSVSDWVKLLWYVAGKTSLADTQLYHRSVVPSVVLVESGPGFFSRECETRGEVPDPASFIRG